MENMQVCQKKGNPCRVAIFPAIATLFFGHRHSVVVHLYTWAIAGVIPFPHPYHQLQILVSCSLATVSVLSDVSSRKEGERVKIYVGCYFYG